MSLHKVLLKIHLYLGMIAGVLLLIIAGTGCILAFDKEIDRLLNPGLWNVSKAPSRIPLTELVDRVTKSAPKTRVASLLVPERDDLAYVANVSRGGQVFVDPYSGNILGTRLVRDGFISNVRQIHAKFLLGRAGEQVVGYSALVAVVLSITGLILWWPRKTLAFRRKYPWRRINFDLHHAVGFFSSLLVMMLALTGCVISFSEAAIPVIFKVTGEPPAPSALPAFTIPAASHPITVERLLEISDSVLKDARTTILPVPRANGDVYAEVAKKAPGDEGNGQCLVYVNQYTGEVTRIDDSRTAAPATRALALNRSLHFGEKFGLGGRIVVFLASFSLVFQVISGFVIWAARQKWKAKKRAPAQAQTA